MQKWLVVVVVVSAVSLADVRLKDQTDEYQWPSAACLLSPQGDLNIFLGAKVGKRPIPNRLQVSISNFIRHFETLQAQKTLKLFLSNRIQTTDPQPAEMGQVWFSDRDLGIDGDKWTVQRLRDKSSSCSLTFDLIDVRKFGLSMKCQNLHPVDGSGVNSFEMDAAHRILCELEPPPALLND
ncbi:MAG: hypothetical protein HY537_05740 [Deltaproteobacteria bacterium]|nr:hypothetical protein [Deltaproteobacteria bacterium]